MYAALCQDQMNCLSGLTSFSLCCFVVCQGLMDSCSEDSLVNDANIRMITLYDNEEVSEMETSCSSRLVRSGDSFTVDARCAGSPRQLLVWVFPCKAVSVIYSELPVMADDSLWQMGRAFSLNSSN